MPENLSEVSKTPLALKGLWRPREQNQVSSLVGRFFSSEPPGNLPYKNCFLAPLLKETLEWFNFVAAVVQSLSCVLLFVTHGL